MYLFFSHSLFFLIFFSLTRLWTEESGDSAPQEVTHLLAGVEGVLGRDLLYLGGQPGPETGPVRQVRQGREVRQALQVRQERQVRQLRQEREVRQALQVRQERQVRQLRQEREVRQALQVRQERQERQVRQTSFEEPK